MRKQYSSRQASCMHAKGRHLMIVCLSFYINMCDEEIICIVSSFDKLQHDPIKSCYIMTHSNSINGHCTYCTTYVWGAANIVTGHRNNPKMKPHVLLLTDVSDICHFLSSYRRLPSEMWWFHRWLQSWAMKIDNPWSVQVTSRPKMVPAHRNLASG